jgi:hypothetical protein
MSETKPLNALGLGVCLYLEAIAWVYFTSMRSDRTPGRLGMYLLTLQARSLVMAHEHRIGATEISVHRRERILVRQDVLVHQIQKAVASIGRKQIPVTVRTVDAEDVRALKVVLHWDTIEPSSGKRVNAWESAYDETPVPTDILRTRRRSQVFDQEADVTTRRVPESSVPTVPVAGPINIEVPTVPIADAEHHDGG